MGQNILYTPQLRIEFFCRYGILFTDTWSEKANLAKAGDAKLWV